VDGEEGAYGVVFPGIPGVGAMGDIVAEALLNAEAALRGYAIEAERDGDGLARPSPLRSIETPVGNRPAAVPIRRVADATSL